MPFLKSLHNTLIISFAILASASCVPKATEKKAVCGENEAFSKVSRSCYSIVENRVKPVGTKSTATILEETPQLVTLTYTDGNKDKALTCSISGISSNLEVISPLVTNGGLFLKADEVLAAFNDVTLSMPGGSSAAALLAYGNMQTNLSAAKNSLSYSTINSEMALFKNEFTSILALAALYPADTTLQAYVTSTQSLVDEFNPMNDMATDRCECSAGVCSAMVIPKINKNGAGGFAYTVTDLDGESAVKAVAVAITPMAKTATHLQPISESSYVVLNESSTSVASSYAITLPTAVDASGTLSSAFQYSSVTLPTKGTLTNCMAFTGSLGLNDTTCTYTPLNGDANDSVAVVNATVTLGDLTFTAKNPGTAGNNYSVQILDIFSDNSSIDAYANRLESFGMVSAATGESFIRIHGNAVKIFVNPTLTTTDEVATLVNAHPMASKMMTAVANLTSTPTPTAAISLAGGVNAFDTFTFRANNGSVNSPVTTVMIKMNPVNDVPMMPRLYIPLFSQTETILEETLNHTVTFSFRDVDSGALPFTIDTKIEDIACTTNVLDAYFTGITTSTNFTILPTNTAAAACTAAGDCTMNLDLTANLDYNGASCLYYRITDSLTGVSVIEKINLVVTPFNDTPLLSSVVIPAPATPYATPVTTALASASIMEDLDSGVSYATFYAGPGGNGFENSQLFTFTATSANTTLIPNTTCNNYTFAAGSPIGSIVPTSVGEYYMDKTNWRCYVSTGTDLDTDWKLHPSLTIIPNRGYTYSGQGSPIGTVAANAAGMFYLDTTANKSYISYEYSTGIYEWKADDKSQGLESFHIVFVPNKDKSGTASIKVKVQDNGGVLNSAVDFLEQSFTLTVTFVNDPPYFATTIPTIVHTNEGGAVQTDAFHVNEDEGDTADEDAQNMSITSITSDNLDVLPLTAIEVFYDLNDNGVEDTGELRAVGDILDPGGINGNLHAFYLKLDPVDGVSGNANLKITVSDNYTTPEEVTVEMSFVVHSVAALHGGWENISSVGLKTDKAGAPVSEEMLQCNYNKTTDANQCGTADCTGTASPHSTVTPDAANVLFWDSASKRCYRSTSASQYSWVEFNTSCPVTRETGVCSNENCIVSSTPNGSVIPSKVGLYYYDSSIKTCHVSTDKVASTNWEVYVPSKVTLAWKPFIMAGSGASSAASIAGWNVYRREAGKDYNFKTGHLKNVNSTATKTIVDPSVRTFTDTTAIAGKVYYYVVRPVDSLRTFPTYTPEIFSEVRVLSSPANYSFVHRWMVNQEICNGMKITTATTPNKVDQTNNFRCQYIGPGHTGGYYDYGRDLLVDSNEMGCAYAAAPKCSANGCVGIGAPSSTANVVANDLYYDRGAGTCYKYNGGWATVEASATMAGITTINSALNAPLVNITQAKAAAICTNRTAPTVGATLGAPILPSKKDYNAYASHPIGLESSEITDIEQGLSLNINSRCNGSQASGLSTAYTDSTIPSTSFNYAISGTDSSGIRSIYTGSIPWAANKGSESCVSRFGIQDVYGNVAEWTTDRMTCASQFVCTSSGTGSSFSSYLFDGPGVDDYYAFDYKSGPYNDANGDGIADALGSPKDTFLTSWTYSSDSFNATKFSYPIGLPINADIENSYAGSAALDWILDIGPSSGIEHEDLHEDGMIVNGLSTFTLGAGSAGSFAVGGSYLSGQMSGRFTAELIHSTLARPDVGARCIIPVSSYPVDADHTYSY